MINRGIIRKIGENNIMVEPIDSEMLEEGSCCSSGGCGSCGGSGKVRKLVKVMNKENKPLIEGSIIQFETPMNMVLLAFFRVLLLPPLAFLTAYNPGGSILAGSLAALGVIAINFLLRNKLKELETPSVK